MALGIGTKALEEALEKHHALEKPKGDKEDPPLIDVHSGLVLRIRSAYKAVADHGLSTRTGAVLLYVNTHFDEAAAFVSAGKMMRELGIESRDDLDDELLGLMRRKLIVIIAEDGDHLILRPWQSRDDEPEETEEPVEEAEAA